MASPSQNSSTDESCTLTTTLGSSVNLVEGGYDYELLGATDSRYECPICLLYLRDPVLTTCGHRFCSGCISQWVIKEGGKCPVDSSTISHENIFPDNYTRREIMSCQAKCPHTKDGCSIVLPLLEMEKHVESEHSSLNNSSNSSKLNGSLNSSSSGMTECFYKEVGCAAYVPQDQLQRHLEMDVHHHLTLLTTAYKRLKIFSTRPSIEFSTPEMLLRQDSRDSSSDSRRWLLADDLMDDDYQFRRQRSWDSVRHARKYHCKPRYPGVAESDESLNQKPHSSDFAKGLGPRQLSGSLTENGDLHLKEIFERLVLLEQSDREKQIKIERLEGQLSSAANVFSTATRLMEDLSTRYCHGIFVWRILGFRKLCLEMRKNPERTIHSPGFYTDIFGYKISLRFNLSVPPVKTPPGQEGSPHFTRPVDVPLEQDNETMISLYIHFMKGEFDETLNWPFNGEMSLMIIHPSAPENSVTEVLKSRPDAEAFKKPIYQRNLTGYGYLQFCPLKKIFTSGFVENDTLICKIVVTTKT